MSDYQLEPRFLTEKDRPLIARFNAGDDHWSSREVTRYLRNHAFDDAALELRRTVLFSHLGCDEIAGYLTISSSALHLDPAGPLDLARPDRIQRVPIVLLSFFGVARQYWGCGVAYEMHLRLLAELQESWIAARLIYLECWEGNDRGVQFWRRLGYEQLGGIEKSGPEGVGPAVLLRMVYDRFALAPIPDDP
jgi:ribosomal protein S18 acetylase RimI-like enzyme